jgi:DNA-binding NarL/FixJ family response regulator
MPVRVILYEDHQDLRESLSVLLRGSPDLELLGAFSTPVDILTHLQTLQPDVVLLDIDMPGMTGLEALQLIRERGLSVNVLMLTVFEDDEHVFEAIRRGAVGYLLKRTAPARLLEAIHDAHEGGAPMTSTVARQVLRLVSEPVRSTEPAPSFTDRERDILKLLVAGNSYKMIAAACGISLDTVRTHIKKIYEKLHVHSQAEAVAKALQRGWA